MSKGTSSVCIGWPPVQPMPAAADRLYRRPSQLRTPRFMLNKGKMPSKQLGFNRVLDGLKKRQLLLDFHFDKAAEVYEPIRNIGVGAFGIVCEAVETTSNNKVAIKKISHASATPTLARRTLREIRVLRYIKHENIVSLRDIFRTPGALGIDVYLVMDLMEGSLHQVIYNENQPLEDELIAYFLYQLLRGLKYIHSAGIAHRDLKPSNLLVNSDCRLRIADFGMAKLASKGHFDEAEEHCFYMTQHVSTLPYRAPELLFVMPEHGTAVDMWAVGCILAEMLLKRELFPGRNVSGQIKILLNSLGKPSDKLLNQIRCEKTRRLIEHFHDACRREWEHVLFVPDRVVSESCLDLMSQLVALDADDRIDIHQAINHPFITSFDFYVPLESSCPFKVNKSASSMYLQIEDCKTACHYSTRHWKHRVEYSR
ncbi:hypothetical protein WR25_18941 isoform B [Diploscapter pachys]|uniref:Protein kinase domain-containing protein n=1 Tax=Diploscapter pachys TaxID=2018661 RepID=A0A2A2K9F9_9BILA|nr:hypothetical protein WR25_18941 isoform B [Diploscapter pachys]